MFSRDFLQIFKKKPPNGVQYWTDFINKSIQKSKKKATNKWDRRLQRPMYVSFVLEDVAYEMSYKLGYAVQLDTIVQIEKEAQGKLDYLHQFALYCYKHEKTFI